MNQNFTKLFSYFDSPEPSKNLLEKITRRVREEQRRWAIKQRLAIFSIGLIFSVPAAILSFQLVRTEMAASGLQEFLSLIMTDSEIVMTYWQNFILIVLESLPTVSLAVFLVALFIFLESLKLLTRELKNFAPLKN
ncbi:MAG: hypothetical protein UU43_C0013G0003 [Candidatus Falkowbacteria bacterium GW2011_GWA2_41_14]|uniref:Uncharacterized protein n=1 Tax=Candidatus Falkowbacteria bacterium GW2011_GWA2_41_14 TaxID=1618635 RepID=A0A0G0XTI9_9BACT|nr:MAG: hypothetical protein UU43_C0013G0003 [Candidatus Falkowbacteria bacterium GW2011_GWA2_41_14]